MTFIYDSPHASKCLLNISLIVNLEKGRVIQSKTVFLQSLTEINSQESVSAYYGEFKLTADQLKQSIAENSQQFLLNFYCMNFL